jgi:hypothetical protein
MVSQQIVEELKIIIREDYDKDLETKEVAQIAENLVNYFDLLAKIYHRDNSCPPQKRGLIEDKKDNFRTP